MIKIVQESQTQVKLHAQKQPWEVFYKKSVLKNFAKFTEKHLWQSLFFNKVLFSCELCEIFKNIFFTEHLRTTASAYSFTIFDY